MQFKQKLVYFALGCAFVVIGQVLLSVVVPKVTAQGKKVQSPSEYLAEQETHRKKETVEFDTVKVRCLQVVDDEGKVRAQLEVTKRSSEALMDDVIQVFNDDGIPVYQVSVSTDGGCVVVNDENGTLCVGMSLLTRGGAIMVCDNNSDAGAMMQVSSAGGIVSVYGNDGKDRAGMGVNEDGHGAVQTWDKDGVISDILGGTMSAGRSTSSISTPKAEEKFEDVKLFPSKDFVEIGEGYAVRNVQFKKAYQYSDGVKVIGEVRIPAYKEGGKPLSVLFSISLFNALGKYRGGTQFSVENVRSKGGIYPFDVIVPDTEFEYVEYCQIRPKGAWRFKSKED